MRPLCLTHMGLEPFLWQNRWLCPAHEREAKSRKLQRINTWKQIGPLVAKVWNASVSVNISLLFLTHMNTHTILQVSYKVIKDTAFVEHTIFANWTAICRRKCKDLFYSTSWRIASSYHTPPAFVRFVSFSITLDLGTGKSRGAVACCHWKQTKSRLQFN